MAVVLNKKSSLLLLHRNNRDSRAFLNVASFQNFLKMGIGSMLFTYGLHFIISNTFVRSLDLHRGRQCLHYLRIITLLDTGRLMVHHQGNGYDYFTFQLLLQVHHCLSKFVRRTKKVYVRLYIFIKFSRKKKVNLSTNMLLNAILCSGTVLNTAMDIYEKPPKVQSMHYARVSQSTWISRALAERFLILKAKEHSYTECKI